MARRAKAADPEPVWRRLPDSYGTTGLELLKLPSGFRYQSIQLDWRHDGGRRPLSQPA